MGHDDGEKPLRNPQTDNFFFRAINGVIAIIDGPVEWFREKVVVPNRKEQNWYHKQYRRVPTIDQCYTDDQVCIFEANQQFVRDKAVDNGILWILRRRFEECVLYEKPNDKEICQPLHDIYNEAVTNWFIKYGDLGAYGKAKHAYYKQKHRLVWERRYGPVGTGKIPLSEKEAQIDTEH